VARTKDPHAATVKAWKTRARNAGGGSVTQQGGDWTKGKGEGQEREFPEQKANPLWKKPKPEFDWSRQGADLRGKRYDAFRKDEKAWNSAMAEAVSLGEVSVKDALAQGFKEGQPDKIVELPDKLYHVTTAAGAVMRDGLKTRDELGQESGVGLGGGDSDTVSFTTDPEIAKGIQRALRDARDFMSDKTTRTDLDADAATGTTTGGKPFSGQVDLFFSVTTGKLGPTLFREGYDPQPKTSLAMKLSDLPKGAKVFGRTWMGGDGVKRVGGYYPKLVPGSSREKQLRWDYFRSYVTARSKAGGPMDPLFFGSDPATLGKTKPSDIRIVEVKPRAGTRGYRMGALGEIRIWTGKVVEKQRLVPEDH